MAHIHVAIFKWKPGTTSQQIDSALEQVRTVAGRVPGLRGIWCGENSSKWSQGFTHAVVVLADSAEAIAAYRSDSVHEQAAKLIEAMELDGIGVDFNDGK